MKKQLYVLMSYLVIFGVVTITAIFDLFKNIELVDIGLNSTITNSIIAIMGFLGIIKTLFYLYFYEKENKKSEKVF